MLRGKISTIIFMAIFFVACSNDSKKIGSNEITINMGGEVQTIDPHINTSNAGSTYIMHAFEGLTRKDKNNKIAPGMASDWKISDDGLVYTFNIREDAKWSDGKPLTANDFVYSFRRVVNPKTGTRYSTLMEPLKNASAITAGKMPIEELGIKAIDDKTLEITLENPTSYFLEFIASTGIYMPVREDIISANGDAWVLNADTYIGNGPYTMTSRNPDVNMVFEINTNYWAKDELVAKKITVVMIADGTASLGGIKEGDIDFSSVFPLGDTDKLMEEGYIEINKALGTSFWEINLTNKAFSDSRVRRALALSIDRNYIVEIVTKTGQVPAGALVPPSINGYKGDFREEAGNYMSTSSKDYEKNVEEAKRLMAEAGYSNGSGYPVIEVLVIPGVRQLEAEAIQQMWKEHLNVDLRVITREWASILQNFRDLSYQLISSGWTGDYNDPTTMLNLYLSHAPANPGYVNAEYDMLLAEASITVDVEARMEILHKAEKILMNDMPIIPTYFRTSTLLVSPKLKNYILDPLAKYRFHYSYLEE